jgi:transcriptional regulator with XRE-family HTH domain
MINKEQSLAIKTKLLVDGKTVADLAREFGVSRTFLSGVINGSQKSKPLEEKLQAYVRGE